MRRLLRILLNFITLLSLLLCVAVAALWVRSHFVAEICSGKGLIDDIRV